MTDTLSTKLRRAFDRARAASEERDYKYGVVGRQNEDGSRSIVVAGRPNYLHVTLDGEQASTIALARNTPRVAGLPIRLKYERGELVIVGVNELALQTFLSGGSGAFTVGFHHHNEGSGLEYPINSTRLRPGRVRFVAALTVHVGEFAYSHDGEWRWWPGGNIDLTSVKPATADTWAWVLVGVDPSTNAAVAVAGASQAVGVELTVDQIESIAFDGYIPCGAVRVREDDVALNLLSRYADARIWLDKLGLLALGGLGDVTLTTPVDGEVLTFDSGEWVNAAAPGDVAAAIDGAAEKTAPDGTDKFGLVEDGLLKWLSWDNLVAGVQAAIDSVYFRLTGRAGGQEAHGGTESGDSLTLRGSVHATSGGVVVDDELAVNENVSVAPDRIVDIGDYGTLDLTNAFLAMRRDINGITGGVLKNNDTDTAGDIRLSIFHDTGAGQLTYSLPGSGNTQSALLGLARATAAFLFTANRNLGIGPVTGHSLYLGTNNTARIIIGATSGNVALAVSGGAVSIGPSAPATSAKLDIQGTDGALLLPRLTTAQRDALTAANGMVIFNTTLGAVETYVGGAWRSAGHQNQTTMSVSGVAGTAVELLPAGTVTAGAHTFYIVLASNGLTLGGTAVRPLNTEIAIFSDGGTNTLMLRTTAGGAVDVRRTAGGLTYTVTAMLVWI